MVTKNELINGVEALVDATSVRDVMDALAAMCGEKAEHIRSSYQDETTAKAWEKAGSRIGTYAASSAIGAVSYAVRS